MGPVSNVAREILEGAQSVGEVLLAREVPLGGPRALMVRRTLPHRVRRMIGPWCFVDHYGPDSTPMVVPPHPHTGLQTVSWLFDGEIEHRDSLGNLQMIKPGQLNLMTAGRSIAHAELSRSSTLHGLQLWVALPDESRHQEPHFEHHAELPVLRTEDFSATLLMGELGDQRSPAATYSPLCAAEITLHSATAVIPLQSELEYGLLAISHEATVNSRHLPAHALLDLGAGHTSLTIFGAPSSQYFLIGGAPFEEELLMWWNFVGRTHDEISAMRENWEAQHGYAAVAYEGERLPAPEMPVTRLKPRKP